MTTDLTKYQIGGNAQDAAILERMAELIAEGFPPGGLDLIAVEDKRTKIKRDKLYVNQLGLTWLTQNDDRGIAVMSSECIIDAITEPKGHARYRATVRFKDGSTFISEGTAQSGTRWEANEIAETRAFNRAMRRATAQTLLRHNLDLYQPEPEPKQPEVTEVKLEDSKLAASDDLDQIYNMDDLDGQPISIVSMESRPRQDGKGDSHILVVECNGSLTRRWAPGLTYVKVQAFFRQYPGQTLECRFIRYEKEGRDGKTFFAWQIGPVGESELSPEEIPF